jgi:curved DNA-binding protein CbpA
MTFSADPYRTLGLVPGATIDEVKRAYRRLAKRYHPDSAGELEVRRFLAVQSAYEQIVSGSGGGSRDVRAPSPWQADPARARASRQGYRARSTGRAGWSSSGWSGGSWWSAGRTTQTPGGGADSPPGARRAGSAGSAGQARPASGPADPAGGPTTGRQRSGGRRKATLNSTSYDEATHEPFEPSWEGAGWYGASSGTYWTINPREYADPRKHGPEYQARARRSTGEHPDSGGPAGAPAGGFGPGRPPEPARDVGSDPLRDDAPPAWAAGGPAATGPGPAVGSSVSDGSDTALSVGILAGLVASVPSVLALLGTGPSGGDLVLPALVAPVAVGIGAAALVRRFGRR